MNIHIGIISHNRPENVKKMQDLIGLPVTWYVGAGERENYIKAGATRVIEAGKLCESRNRILKESFSLKCYAVELSDDLEKICYALSLKGNKKEVVTFEFAINTMYELLKRSPFYLAGVSPTDNPFFVTDDVSTRNFIVGDFIMVKPCELFFDENMILKEDYDYTAQHIKMFGGALRVNRILATFKHYSNKGGAVEVRTSELEEKTINYLFEKHKGFFKRNTKRKNEILFNLKK